MEYLSGRILPKKNCNWLKMFVSGNALAYFVMASISKNKKLYDIDKMIIRVIVFSLLPTVARNKLTCLPLANSNV